MRSHNWGLQDRNRVDVAHLVGEDDVGLATLGEQHRGAHSSRRFVGIGRDHEPLFARRQALAELLEEFRGLERVQHDEFNVVEDLE